MSDDVATISHDVDLALACGAGPESETGLNCTAVATTTRRDENSLLHYLDTAQPPSELLTGAQTLGDEAVGLLATPMTYPIGWIDQSGVVQQMQTTISEMDSDEGIGTS